MKKITVTLRNGNVLPEFSPCYPARETRAFLVIEEESGKTTYIPLADVAGYVQETIAY